MTNEEMIKKITDIILHNVKIYEGKEEIRLRFPVELIIKKGLLTQVKLSDNVI